MKRIGILIIVILLTICACKENSNLTEPSNNIPRLPALSDKVPYDKMGGGKVLFERIGPFDNNYSGVYVLDINNKKSWGIEYGAIIGPQVSPNGDKIAFTKYSNLDTKYDLYISDINGNNVSQSSSINGQEHCPTWSPDNQKIVYYSYSFNSNEDMPVFIYYTKTGTTSKIIDLGKVDPPNLYTPMDIVSYTNNGKLITSLSGKGIYIMDENGNNLRAILKQYEPYLYYSPRCNPKVSKIAVIASKYDTLYNVEEMSIITFNEDGSDSTNIYSSPDNMPEGSWAGDNNFSLCWSPDGTKILFNKREGHLTAHIYMINADGTGLTSITTAEGVTDRSISWGN